MYDWDSDEYIGFLKDLYTQPIQHEDDPEEDDPEYNVCEDEDSDKRELIINLWIYIYTYSSIVKKCWYLMK